MFQLYKDLKILYYVIGLSVVIPLAPYSAWTEKIGFFLLAIQLPFV